MPGKREENSQRKRERILEAALIEFGLKGVAETRIEDIAKRAQVGKGTIYLYFSGKYELFRALISHYICIDKICEIKNRRDLSASEKIEKIVEPLTSGINSLSGKAMLLVWSESFRNIENTQFYIENFARPVIDVVKEIAESTNCPPIFKKEPSLLLSPVIHGLMIENSGLRTNYNLAKVFREYLQTVLGE